MVVILVEINVFDFRDTKHSDLLKGDMLFLWVWHVYELWYHSTLKLHIQFLSFFHDEIDILEFSFLNLLVYMLSYYLLRIFYK